MPKPPILLTDEIVPPPALIRAGLEALHMDTFGADFQYHASR